MNVAVPLKRLLSARVFGPTVLLASLVCVRWLLVCARPFSLFLTVLVDWA